jgi:hypothetical protein
MSRLEVVDGLPHVSLGGEYESGKAVIIEFHLQAR